MLLIARFSTHALLLAHLYCIELTIAMIDAVTQPSKRNKRNTHHSFNNAPLESPTSNGTYIMPKRWRFTSTIELKSSSNSQCPFSITCPTLISLDFRASWGFKPGHSLSLTYCSSLAARAPTCLIIN